MDMSESPDIYHIRGYIMNIRLIEGHTLPLSAMPDMGYVCVHVPVVGTYVTISETGDKEYVVVNVTITQDENGFVGKATIRAISEESDDIGEMPFECGISHLSVI